MSKANSPPPNKPAGSAGFFNYWLVNSPLFSIPRRVTLRVINGLLSRRNLKAVVATGSYRAEDYALIHRIMSEIDMLLVEDEAYQVLSCARSTGRIEGHMAEVGVYRGGSARLMCEARNGRTIYLFDTFEGLPDAGRLDALFTAGQYKATEEAVRSYLSPFPDVHIFKGIFPETSGPILDKHFSFVHLDVDIYEAMRDCLAFFYPRVKPGGIILIHDYLWAEGVRAAVQEFWSSRPEPILELAGAYCGVVKL